MGTSVGLVEKVTDGFGSNGLYEGLCFLIDFFAVEGDVVIEVVIDLDSSHPYK